MIRKLKFSNFVPMQLLCYVRSTVLYKRLTFSDLSKKLYLISL